MATKFSWHSILQVLATIAQIGNAVAVGMQATSPKTAVIIATVTGCIQVVLHQYGYSATPPSAK